MNIEKGDDYFHLLFRFFCVCFLLFCFSLNLLGLICRLSPFYFCASAVLCFEAFIYSFVFMHIYLSMYQFHIFICLFSNGRLQVIFLVTVEEEGAQHKERTDCYFYGKAEEIKILKKKKKRKFGKLKHPIFFLC